mmetsp:Transcript_29221/g.70482  ORF Transcript_29221/g.70482 Transcript_29221/m.70482 type:complete len:564 (-) Transcript_29221:179-1870(-)
MVGVEFDGRVPQEGRGRSVSDGHEDCANVHGRLLAGVYVLQDGAAHHPGDRCVQIDILALILGVLGVGGLADYLREDGVPPYGDGGVFHDALGEDFGGSEGIPPMDHGDGLARPGQHQSVLHRRITPSHDQYVLAAIHVPIARRAAAHASPPQLVLPGHVQPVALRSRGNDDRMSLNRRRVRPHPDGTARRVYPHDLLCLEQRAEFHGLRPHQRDYRGSGDVEQSGVILDVDALALQLSSHGRGDDHGPQSRPGGVDRRAQSRRPASDDGHPLRELGRGPGVLELGIVVLLVLHLGVALGILPLLDFGHELFLRGEVQVGLAGFAPRFLLLLVAAAAALSSTSLGGVILRLLRFESIRDLRPVSILLPEALDEIPRHPSHAKLVRIVALHLTDALIVNLRDVVLALARILLCVILHQILHGKERVLHLGLLNDALRELPELALSRAAEFVHLLPPQEELERGEAAHSVPRTQLVQAVGVHLHEYGLVADLLGELFEDGSDHPTGAAAVGVEVDYDRQAGLGGVLLHQPVEFVGGSDVTHDGPGMDEQLLRRRRHGDDEQEESD